MLMLLHDSLGTVRSHLEVSENTLVQARRVVKTCDKHMVVVKTVAADYLSKFNKLQGEVSVIQ
jgi:hypothetical protein